MKDKNWLKEIKRKSAKRRLFLEKQLGVKIQTKERKLDFDNEIKKETTNDNSNINEPLSDIKSNVPLNNMMFLKGTSSKNPHNDYSQYFVDTAKRPQNFIRDTRANERFEEFPKLKELIILKDQLVASKASPPMSFRCDLRNFPLTNLKSLFDVVIIEPPLMEYTRNTPFIESTFDSWNWDEIRSLEINEVAAARSFVFLWCGSKDGLEEGRKCLSEWGFRRCEDICWIKSNRYHVGLTGPIETNSIFQNTKEHCLMGIRGTVRRNTDADFIHSNIDLDVVVTEENDPGCFDKPEEIINIAERFCLGLRRLYVFGKDKYIRPGWVNVGPNVSESNYDSSKFIGWFPDGNYILGTTPEIELLRPKSPPNRQKPNLQPVNISDLNNPSFESYDLM